MKFSEIPYKRYTIEEGRIAFDEVKKKIEDAENVEDLLAAKKLFDDMTDEYSTAASLSNCRFTLNTGDAFYSKEVEYYDEIGPLFQELFVSYFKLLLASPFANELRSKLNPKFFGQAEISMKTFSPEVIEDCQKENAIVTEYSRLMSSMLFDWEGEQIPLSVLRGNLENADRAVRQKCAVAIGEGLKKHAEELDDIYDRLVKIRTRIAQKLGYKNFVELGYYRMGRLDYTANMVEKFRDNVALDIVPVVTALKNSLAKELGYENIHFYDDAIYTIGKNPKPILDKNGIFAAAVEMYNEMDEEVGKFMRDMLEGEYFDVDAREGKWGGGYCTEFAKYKQPFILANFNGTTGDIDVITHEFGHALHAYFSFHYGDRDVDLTMETAECHSMSMEFLCWKYIDRFFGEMGNAYRKKHLLSAISFIPYGVIVDEFQQKVYETPDMTPADRKELYLSLEKKYRPYLDLSDVPYISEGTRWQYQMHIFETPFYYIDYCLAQTVSLWFLVMSRENYSEALKRYLKLSKTGSEKPFEELLEAVGIPSPFKEGSLSELAKEVLEIKRTL